MVKYTLEQWVEKSNEVHKNKYDYSKAIYKLAKDKVCIICPIHGEFMQSASKHLSGQACPKCSKVYKWSTLEWIDASNIIHNNKFDYSKTIYVNAITKVKIICPEHGEFEQIPYDHQISKTGCTKCSREDVAEDRRFTLEEFIEKANIIHKNLYDYPNQSYKNMQTPIKIICNKHGIFEQLPSNHLRGSGCPICNYSKGELLIYNWLKENNIKFKAQFELITSEIARNSNLLVIDFFVKHNEKQYFIEYDGIQHFEFNSFFHKTEEDFFKQQRRDRVLNEFCELHKDKVTLIRLDHTQSDNQIIEILNKI